jgi:hypothetical protein
MEFAESSSKYIGNRVIVTKKDGGTVPGVVKFIGETKFGAGKWIGVELDLPGTLCSLFEEPLQWERIMGLWVMFFIFRVEMIGVYS